MFWKVDKGIEFSFADRFYVCEAMEGNRLVKLKCMNLYIYKWNIIRSEAQTLWCIGPDRFPVNRGTSL
jgi:hypothetical protein